MAATGTSAVLNLFPDPARVEAIFFKLLAKNDSSRHGVLVPKKAYWFFPNLPSVGEGEPDPAVPMETAWNGGGRWTTQESWFRQYDQYPERRMTALAPEIDSNSTRRLLVVAQVTGSAAYFCVCLTPDAGSRFDDVANELSIPQAGSVAGTFDRASVGSLRSGRPARSPGVYRLNVGADQVAACIEHRAFALAGPRHGMQSGDVLLLQLNKADATRLGEADARVRHALIFEGNEPDPDGTVSRQYWPDFEPQRNATILRCSAVLPVQPFSFTVPPFSKDYWSAQNATRLEVGDALIALDRVEGGGIDPFEPLEDSPVDPHLMRDAELQTKVERYAVDRVKESLCQRFPGSTVAELPRNNKGYDIVVLNGPLPTLYVEVKGTLRPGAFFFLSESEREFSAANSDRYELYVVWGIERDFSAHAGVERRAGEVTAASHDLAPFSWSGRLDSI